MNVKKYIFLVAICTIFLTGCTDTDDNEIQFSLSGDYFTVATPFKRGVAENYIPVATGNRIDLNETELGLMRIATKYHDTSNYLFQAGQFLTTRKVDNIIEKTNEDNPYVAYLVEQNYLTKSNNLAGIAIGVVINPFINDETLTTDEIKALMLRISPIILSELRSNEELENTPVIIAAYLMRPRTSLVPGSYILEQRTRTNEIEEFNFINEEYYVLTDSSLISMDEPTFRAFANIRADLETKFPNIVITGTGHYYNERLKQLHIDVNAGFIRPHEVLAISNHLITEFNRNFSRNINIIINVNSDRETLAILTINSNTRDNINLLI